MKKAVDEAKTTGKAAEKGKAWKNMSSSYKDYISYLRAIRDGDIDADTPYE